MTDTRRPELLDALGRDDEIAARETLAAAVQALLTKFDALAPEMQQSHVRTAEQRDNAVARADVEVEHLVVVVGALVQYGSAAALADVARALQHVADASAWEGDHTDLSGLVRVLLARLLWGITTLALFLDRAEMLPLLNRVALPSRYGSSSAAVEDTSLRYAAFYEGSAGKTYAALFEWFKGLNALGDFPLLTLRGGLEQAFAEADLVLGLRLLAERERDVYCEGAALGGRPAEQRLVRRLADPAQASSLAAFYGVAVGQLSDVLDERYKKVAAKGPWGRGNGSLFVQD